MEARHEKHDGQMHGEDPVLQEVEEGQVQVQRVHGLLGRVGDPQQFDDHRLSHQKREKVDQRESYYIGGIFTDGTWDLVL